MYLGAFFAYNIYCNSIGPGWHCGSAQAKEILLHSNVGSQHISFPPVIILNSFLFNFLPLFRF